MDKYIGMILDDRYEILEVIGVGGMAVVCKAMCHRLNRLVAIKILKEEYTHDEEFRRRFHGESQAVAMMSHPNIVNVYDVSHSDDMDYIVMELIDGITLKQYMEKKGILTWRETLHFSMQIAKALEHAHSRGIIHRDIKPHNIMVLKDGSVKVADFGIARVASSQNTLTKEALGSVHYISPEQAKGGRVDNRTDLYSLGVVMYQMLTGRPPYDGDTPVSVAIQHINGTPVKPSLLNSNIPLGLEQITMHAMCSDLKIRYASATDILRDMEELRKSPSVMFNFSATAAEHGHVQNAVQRPAAVTRQQGVSTQPRTARRVEASAEEDDERERNKRLIMTIAIACAAALIVGLLLFIFFKLLPRDSQPEDTVSVTTEAEAIVVPNFVGQKYNEQLVNNYPDFVFIVDENSYEYSSEPAGTIIRQDMQPDMTVKPGREIYLSISKGERGRMEDLTGMSIEAVNQFYAGSGIRIKQMEEYNSEVEKGCVIRTEPMADMPLEDDATITVYISKGPEQVQVPDVYNYTLSAAQSLLNDAKLAYSISYEFSDSVDNGCIISQYPNAQTEVDVGTSVTLVVSKGKNVTSVSNVVGQNVDSAKSQLTAAGFTVTVNETETSDYPAGTVMNQSPAGGTELAPGSTVTLTVAKAAPKETEPEPSETETEPQPPTPSENEVTP